MSRNDYFVIVYKVLSYLYERLKNGQRIDITLINENSLGIPESYWNYIFYHMYTDGLIENVSPLRVIGSDAPALKFGADGPTITPKGIEYLQENTMMEKAKRAIKEIKDIIPGF